MIVIGAGEVGRALAEVLGCELRDVEGTPHPVEVVHIAFPWSEGFEAAVREYQEAYQPDLTVIHSTVPIGTSRRLGAVHSSVTGRHPHLVESLLTFRKFFGGPDARRAAASWPGPVEIVPDQETTEAGKLLQTLQFGWQVLLQKEAYRLCRASGADPEVAYGRFNAAYSAGYAELGEPFRLPVLRDMPGPIGGHCVIPNARLTASYLAEQLVEMDAWLSRWERVA